jgi:hypothetical protein
MANNGYGRQGSAGSAKGRHYQKKSCLRCGKSYASNVLPQHERTCAAPPTEASEKAHYEKILREHEGVPLQRKP